MRERLQEAVENLVETAGEKKYALTEMMHTYSHLFIDALAGQRKKICKDFVNRSDGVRRAERVLVGVNLIIFLAHLINQGMHNRAEFNPESILPRRDGFHESVESEDAERIWGALNGYPVLFQRPNKK